MFCSPACRLSSEYNMQQLAAMRKKQAGKKPTKLELLGYSILDEIGLEYEKQYIFDRFVADAYVKELNLIVQFDGDYWHGNTSKFPTLSEFQMKQTERDRRADAKARDLGHRVIRLWESDVYKDQQAVKNRILLKE
jgi:very-short-patch-repair endonuclease